MLIDTQLLQATSTFNEFGKFEQVSVRVLDHEIKLDRLKQYTLQRHHFFLLRGKTMHHMYETQISSAHACTYELVFSWLSLVVLRFFSATVLGSTVALMVRCSVRLSSVCL